MANRIGHVTIVGGGSAGWLTAAILAATLNGRARDNVRIAVIESPSVPRVGVGEATTPTVTDTLRALEIDEAEFLRRCDATFKTAVKFVGWNHRADGTDRAFHHPFFAPGPQHGFVPAYHFFKAQKQGLDTALDTTLTPAEVLFERHRAPKPVEGPDYQSNFRYAYHLDAQLFAEFLREYARARGVAFIPDDVQDVSLDERGFVASLKLAQRGDFPVEFVVDCTGFRSLILGEALGEPFEPFGHNLLCDRAVAINLPYPEDEQGRIEPYTSATTLAAGWVWRIPLYSRRGLGYVFSGAHTSDDEAVRAFMIHLGVAEPYPDARVIPMRIGRMRRSWVGNCVGIGLAGGFIEPLESTSLHFTQMAIRLLVQFFPDRGVSPPLAEGYNQAISGLYDEVRDFICMHYFTSNRSDTEFWRAVREHAVMPDSLAARLALWRHKLPDQHDTIGNSLFTYWSHIYVLGGKGYFDGLDLPLESAVTEQDFTAFLRVIHGAREELARTLPDHRAYLERIRSGPR